MCFFFVYYRAPEPQVLDYQTQQYKLFPWLAASYAYSFAARYLYDANDVFQKELSTGDTSKLKEVRLCN